MNYEQIKAMAKAEGVKVTDLLALAPGNDPFYVGRDGDVQNGQWFADLWSRFLYSTGVHIRRVHYQIISQSPAVLMPNGEPYENTEECWNFINVASKAARYLGLVDVGAFVDRRNPEPKIYRYFNDSEPSLGVSNPADWTQVGLPGFPELPNYQLYSFDARQRYHLEIWCEKSTMNDVLIPLCERYGINLVTGVGEMSITAVHQLANRFREGVPVRIFYISDFDPAGQSMPVAVARKLEYLQRNEGYEADVRLFPVVLTARQVEDFNLPRTPIKASERRAGKFEERHGAGAVELDALEALHPGVLRSILVRWIKRYWDTNLHSRVQEVRLSYLEELGKVRETVLSPFASDVESLREEYAALGAEIEERIQDFSARLSRLWSDIQAELEDKAVAVPLVPLAEEASEAAGALYDSELEYMEQLELYKGFQGR
jgi:hypothetical protein